MAKHQKHGNHRLKIIIDSNRGQSDKNSTQRPPNPLSLGNYKILKKGSSVTSIFSKLLKAQKAFLSAPSKNTDSYEIVHFSENGLDLSLDKYGYMTAATSDVTSRMANLTTQEKIEVYRNSLEHEPETLVP